MFRNAIVRLPCPSIIDGLTSACLENLITKRHWSSTQSYTETLRNTADLKVKVLEADDLHPDSTFIEDVALCTSELCGNNKSRS